MSLFSLRCYDWFTVLVHGVFALRISNEKMFMILCGII